MSIVVPVYNERETLPELYRRVVDELDGMEHAVEIVLVDDGSRDGSTDLIRELVRRDPRVRGVRLSRNFGHNAAIEAGLREARGDAVIIMDADLQDDPSALRRMIAAWEEGADVAYAVRTRRKEGLVLRTAYSSFYRLANRTMSIDFPRDAGPFSLMSRRVVDQLNDMGEYNRYFPGLRAFVGFRQVPVVVERAPRHAGETKYSAGKYAALASNALLSFSKLPLRLAIYLGLTSAALSLAAAVVVLALVIASGGNAPPGWASLMVVVLLLAGIQLLTLGILGEYVGKVFDEVRRRPTFIVAERYEGDDGAAAG